MASTWVGGKNNKASNPKNWSPEGVPTNTNADITFGTLNIEGSILAGAPAASPQVFLEVNGDVDIIMRRSPGSKEAVVVRPIDVQSGDVHIEVKDDARFNLFEQPGASTVVLLPLTTRWSGMISAAGDLKVLGNGTFVPTEDSLVYSERGQPNGHTFIDAKIAKGEPIHVFNASLEVGGFVAAGEIIAVTGDQDRPGFLKVDTPRAFSGEVHLGHASQLELNDLAKRVDSYSLKDDLLSFYDHNEVVYTLVESGGNHPTVVKSGSDVFLYTDDVAPAKGTLLPLHS